MVAAVVQGEAVVVVEVGEEGQVEGAGLEVVDQAGGQAFLCLSQVSPRVSGPGQRVWLGPPHDE